VASLDGNRVDPEPGWPAARLPRADQVACG